MGKLQSYRECRIASESQPLAPFLPHMAKHVAIATYIIVNRIAICIIESNLDNFIASYLLSIYSLAIYKLTGLFY